MATSSESSMSMSALLHTLKIPLSSTNFLLWKNQIMPLLLEKGLVGHVDGTDPAPPETITTDGTSAINPRFTAWKDADRHAALEAEYCNASVERVHNLTDQLRSLVKGTDSVMDFSRKFKALSNQLADIGHPVDETNKLYWFTAGLGAQYISFTSIVRAARPPPSFPDLVAHAVSHEVLLRDLQGQATPPAAFVATSFRSSRHGGNWRGQNRGYRNYRGGRNNRGGRHFHGYATQYKGFRCFEPVSQRVYITRHATFDESYFPFIEQSTPQNYANLELTSFVENCWTCPTSHQPTEDAAQNTPPCSPTTATKDSAHCGLCIDDPDGPPVQPTNAGPAADAPNEPPANPPDEPDSPLSPQSASPATAYKPLTRL
ncbi:hypothetical protein SSX86_030729 [Deinandra increscens subsp. villosa]|uniref:Retroviral polymerase SH3-like domain-containing protein n=1 Tax=Deinandra increscens subsp. villosa TaxID=3103831 RepID=A0AAP0C6N8_9ASTR